MKRVLLWILGIVIVLGVAGAILLGRIDTQFVVNQIADATAKATGKPLVFASAPSLSLLPPGVKFGQAGWGEIKDGVIVKASEPKITCQCIRVPVLDGHTAAVFVKFRKKPTKEQLIEKLVNFKGLPQELELPSAPKQFIQYLEEDNRPQVQLDVNYEKGMGVSVGRLREDKVYDWKFVGLSHNTLRGAAGGAVLCAELLTAQGYIQAK